MSPSVCFFNYLQDMCINNFAYLIPWLSTLRMRNDRSALCLLAFPRFPSCYCYYSGPFTLYDLSINNFPSLFMYKHIDENAGT